MRGSQASSTLCILAAQLVVTASGFQSVVLVGQADFRNGGKCGSSITRVVSSPLQMSFFGFFDKGPERIPRTKDDSDIVSLEKEVLSSVQAQVDRKNAKRALVSALSDDPELSRATTPQWAAAIAAAAIAGSLSFVTFQNVPLGAVVAMSVGFVASRNPVEEEDAVGSIARTVGRYTIASVEAATPKAKAMARVALTGQEELVELREKTEDLEMRLAALQEENSQLHLWKQRRIWIDEVLPNYNLQSLKEEARKNNLLVGGTKTQLLMRLVEAEVIQPDLGDLDRR